MAVPELILPDRSVVPPLHEADHDGLVDLIYHPISGILYRRRFRMALAALTRTEPRVRILEAGFGAGLLLPTLGRIFPEVEAVDVHGQAPAVGNMLQRLRLRNVRVRDGSILDLPFPDGHFSHVVSVSVLEHLKDLDGAARELARVTQAGGVVVLGFPTKNLVTKALFKVVGYDDDVIHPSSHRQIVSAMERRMTLERLDIFPRYAPFDLSLYAVARFRVVPGS